LLTETARIVKVEQDAIWVMATEKTACGGCAEQKGCGTGALAQWMARKSLLRVAIKDKPADLFHCEDEVVIGVPEEVVISGTLLLYVLPLLAMIIGAGIGYWQFATDLATATFAAIGLLTGGYLAARQSARRNDPAKIHPVLLEHLPATSV